MSAWRTLMVYLGLGPDEEYEDYGAPAQAQPQSGPAPAPAEPARVEHETVHPIGGLHRQTGAQPEPVVESAISDVRPLPSAGPAEERPVTRDAGHAPREQPRSEDGGELGSVRAIPISSAKPQVVAPRGFNQAQEVGDRFRDGLPVIVNLQGTDRELARRIIDFTSGLCYGLGGQMERVAKDVYLLTPADVEVSDEERRRLSERGLHDH